MRRCRKEKPRAALAMSARFAPRAMLRSVARLSFLFRILSSSRCSVAVSSGITPRAALASTLAASNSGLEVYMRLRLGPSPSSPPFSSSSSATGDGGGAGCTYDTRSLASLITPSSLPLANSSVKSATPPLNVLCTRNLSLHELMSVGHSRCACMMTCTTMLCPAATSPVLGFTQYFLGAVVFTLNAISSPPVLVSRIVVGICFFSSNRNLSSLSGLICIASAMLPLP
mmetsp:Transcript_35465/g.87154  ORF Transcript_35465/g.87154 Transcript_35465/m.87154 type:complete len:228 (+) Transcript_35465:721-1404(+)